LDAIISQRGLDEVPLVAHDASGPPAIDWALDHPDHVSALILLTAYYCLMPTLRPPEAIALDSTPLVRNVARGVARASKYLDRKLYTWQVGRFISGASARQELVPCLYDAFGLARPAFCALNDDLLGTVVSRPRRTPELRWFTRPVRIIFGARDPT
jgi:haloalkane dehalogenase